MKLPESSDGVSRLQKLVGGWLLLPLYSAPLSWEGAVERTEAQARRLIATADGRSEQQLLERVQVPPQIGLEDSSRDYSWAMALEHLTIVGESVSKLVAALTHDTQPDGVVTTAVLKPSGNLPLDRVIFDYRRAISRFGEVALDSTADRRSRRRFDHPWFGGMTAGSWVSFVPFHQEIHIKQAGAILEKVDDR